MTTRQRQPYIAQLKRCMYPPKPWQNPRDLYGRKKWQEIEALQKGEIGTFSGMSIVYATPPDHQRGEIDND